MQAQNRQAMRREISVDLAYQETEAGRSRIRDVPKEREA